MCILTSLEDKPRFLNPKKGQTSPNLQGSRCAVAFGPERLLLTGRQEDCRSIQMSARNIRKELFVSSRANAPFFVSLRTRTRMLIEPGFSSPPGMLTQPRQPRKKQIRQRPNNKTAQRDNLRVITRPLLTVLTTYEQTTLNATLTSPNHRHSRGSVTHTQKRFAIR